jgi:transposase-like protein
MPKPISIEVRQRAVAAYEAGAVSYDETAKRFGVSRRSLQRWVERRRDSGTVEPNPPGGGYLSPVDMKRLRSLVEARPDGTTYELAAEYNRFRCIDLLRHTFPADLGRLVAVPARNTASISALLASHAPDSTRARAPRDAQCT